MNAPMPERRPHTHREHGIERDDPWHWLRDRDDPAVLAWLKTENAHTEAATAHRTRLREQLYVELLGRIQETDSSAPVRDAGWWYYTRTEAGNSYAIHCRRRDQESAEQILVDENALARGHDFFDLGDCEVSPSHTLLAWSTDTTGDEVYTLRLRDLRTGADLPDVIEDIAPGMAWSAHDHTLFYLTLDETLRPYQLWRHRLGTDRDHDVLVYEEPDPTFRLSIDRTRDDRWLLLASAASKTTEVHYRQADEPEGPFTLFAARHPGHEYAVTSQDDRFLVLTNDSDGPDGGHDDRALDFALKTCFTADTRRHAWQTLVPPRPGITLEGVDAFRDLLILHERDQGLVHLRAISRDGRIDKRLPMPEPAFAVASDANPCFDSASYRFSYTSLRTPWTTCAWHVLEDRLERLKETPVLGGFDRDRYITDRLWATSHDGVQVPVSVVYRKDLGPGPHPCLLDAYGAYGIPNDPTFRSSRLSLLDRGVVVALAHVRGGGDLGRRWYEAGRLQHKPNTFHDTVAIADALFAAGLTAPDRLVLHGGSAGGLLVGAALNLAPERFRAAVAEVPFVDALTTMLDASLPLTTNEYDEWGNPQHRTAYDAIRAWSPYDNVRAADYPDVLVTAGLNDPRVSYWEPAKWAARLRERTTGSSQILLHVHLGAGHGGPSGRYGHLRDLAFVWSWILDRLGVADTAVRDPFEGEERPRRAEGSVLRRT